VSRRNCLGAVKAGSVGLALVSLVFVPGGARAQSAAASAAPDTKTNNVLTPRTADGHPDLTAVWSTGREFLAGYAADVSPDGKKRGVYIKTETSNEDGKGLEEHVSNRAKQVLAARAKDPNKPPYKPELLDKVKSLADHYEHTDPTFRCEPPGVPRMGPPNQVVQSPGQVVFLYATNVGNFFRVIPTDGRAHQKDVDPSYLGDSVAHWEGDTLVVDAIGFNDETWLQAETGYIHSEAMHVVERLSRDGNMLHYQVTIEDPNVFTRPWTPNPRTLKVGGPDAALVEADPCHDLDEPHMPKDYSAPL